MRIVFNYLKKSKYLFLSVFILLALIDLFSILNAKMGIFWLILSWIFVIISWELEAKISILVSIGYLTVCVLLLIAGKWPKADEMAARSFLFLTIGMAETLIDIRKGLREKAKETKK